MKAIKRCACVLVSAALSVTLLCGCSSTALPFSISENIQSAARSAQENIKSLVEGITGNRSGSGTDGSGSVSGSESGDGQEEEVQEQENSSLYYYYGQLDSNEKNLYNTLLSVAKTPEDNKNGKTVRLPVSPESDEFTQVYQLAYSALISDHPELFWLTQGDSGFVYTYPRVSLTGTYPVTVTLREAHSDAAQMTSQLDSAASDLLTQVDLSQTAPQIALQIHDRLIDLVSYDSAAAESGSTDLAHTAYGALVQDSSGNKNRAVCDGYVYAYEYLLQKAGIKCAVVNGRAGEDTGSTQSHSWILVNLDGQWYETDPTWDDVDLSSSSDPNYSGLQSQALSDESYVGKLRHYLYDVTTDEMSSFTPDDRYVYHTVMGWASFLGPSVHIRNQAGEEERTGDYTTPLAPTAEGTQYSYSNLTGN